MAVVIRMKRAGAKKRPFYRVVVANSRSPRDGRYIEQLGYYDPLTDPATFKVDAERFAKWIRHGALPSESVGVMMAKHAPEALRPAPLAAPAAPVEKAAGEAKPKKAKTARPKAAKAKTVRKPGAATKGIAKKAMTRAKAKAKKASGVVAKPKAKKKPKK
jgi:small subunit ribosomal protein S16